MRARSRWQRYRCMGGATEGTLRTEFISPAMSRLGDWHTVLPAGGFVPHPTSVWFQTVGHAENVEQAMVGLLYGLCSDDDVEADSTYHRLLKSQVPEHFAGAYCIDIIPTYHVIRTVQCLATLYFLSG